MSNKNKGIDKYIDSSKPFAQPILDHLRGIVHDACPDVEEQLKWSVPNFMYKNKILCNMAAFNAHCSFGFWNSSQMSDPDNILIGKEKKGGLGNLGKIQSIKDLPSKTILKKYIKQAMRLVDSGASMNRAISKESTLHAEVSKELNEALNSNDKVKKIFIKFPPGQKKEYHEWINDAKTDATRNKRLDTAIKWISDGKPRNWKYMNKYK